ncbi:MAG: CHRD domain-containing protein [Thermoproteota archaeon]|nr:CHRD domain-containing protein [Thermoproteota archaeon]
MSCNRNMYLIVVAAALTSLILVGATNTYAQNEQFRARLDGNNEVPPVDTPAEGVINFKTKNDMLTWKMNITGITDATGAHIHNGQAGENGDVIVDLLKTSKHSDTATGMIMRGNVTASSLQGAMEGKTLEDLKTAMGNGDTYVNVHTTDHPDGMIRGQVKIKGGNETSTASLNTTDTTSTQ